MALLEVDHVAAGYVEGIDILADIALRVEPGSITGIIGPNGAGKSTLLKTIFGLLHPRRGRILHGGREIQALAPYAIKRLGISYVPQGQSILPQLTVEENLQLGAWIARHDRAGVASILERAYATFPRLRERRRRRATSLSGGEAKMLSLAKELVNDPVLLLVDEPSAGLAPRIAHLVYDELVAARARGVTLLLIDQNITKAVEISDYLYMIEGGQVRREGPREHFAGVGAYTSALLVQHTRLPMLVGIVAGAVLATGLGYVLGSLCLRMRAIYLALATWAFAESIRLLVTVEYQITRGDLGLRTSL